MTCRFKSSLGYWLIFIIVFLLLPAVTACRSSKILSSVGEEQAVSDILVEIISPSKIQTECPSLCTSLGNITIDLQGCAQASRADLQAGARFSRDGTSVDTTKIHITQMQQRKQTSNISQESNPKRGELDIAHQTSLNYGWLIIVAVCAAALVFCVRYFKI